MKAFSFLLLVLLTSVPAFAQADDAPTTKPAKGEKVRPNPIGEPVVYKKADGKDLRLFLVKPDGWKAADQRPAMVLIHGGGWKQGYPALHNNQATVFAKRGMVCFLVEYRLLGKGNKTDLPTGACQDAKSAMRYVRGHAKELGIDPNRIAASGGSAGGHLAAFVSMVDGLDDPNDDLKISPKADALVLYCPALNVGPDSFFTERYGDKFKAYSPAHNVTAAAPPTFIAIGDQDAYIPKKEIEAFQGEMKKHNVRCDVSFQPGWDHGFFQTPNKQAKVLAEGDTFLVSLGWLKPAATQP